MGQCLKDAYAERDLAKALAKAHGLIDEETKKLSDKVKNLTLSHNRMRNLLKMTLSAIDKWRYSDDEDCIDDFIYLRKRITLELYGLENYKGLKGGK